MVPALVTVLFLLALVLYPLDSVARITKCGGPGARGFCLEYETEHLKVGESQTYTVVGDFPPFQISFVQNGDRVRLEGIGGRGFRLTAVKETVVHYAGNNYAGMTVILDQDPSREILSAVGYYHYDRENYSGAGFLRTPFTARPVWDAWFREVITYDPAMGRTTLSINNGPPLAYTGRPASGPFRPGMHSYGWGTGHYQKVRALSMEWTN